MKDPGAYEGLLLGGRYRLVAPVGVGGMAVVWQARDEVLGRAVAVKLLAPAHTGDARSRERIRREARAAAALSHPNIAQVHDYGETGLAGQVFPYVVMELVPGGTLSARLRAGALAPQFAMRIGAEIAAALAAAHAEGLVHRDIKPGNVMLAPTGAKVVDFGIAAAVAPDGSGLPDDPEEVLGTPAYLAPERLVGDSVVPASDVYALGVVLYRMLSGRSPWSSEDTRQMVRAHLYIPPAPLPSVHGVPEYVVRLADRCLAKNPGQRPSAEEAASVLAHGAGIRVVADAAPAPPNSESPSAALPLLSATPPVASSAVSSATPPVASSVVSSGAPPVASSVVSSGAPSGSVSELSPSRRRIAAIWWIAAAFAVIAAVGVGVWLLADRPIDEASQADDRTVAAGSSAPVPPVPPGATAGATTATAGQAPGTKPEQRSRPAVVEQAPSRQQIPSPGTVAPTATTASPSPTPTVERTLSSDGGTVVATCTDPATARLLSWTPARSYRVQSVDPGPSTSTSVAFKHGNDVITMTVTCVDGIPAADIAQP
ncbi:serine/threonine-protein kinase [Actinoplanes sichuanensis]|uniref:non-specific serine/threonine protein kinase n=2 Tax=Actinoplanes sichuanensis TaxID=512349 RepID=A0ABW4ASC9_9ACTN